VLVTLEEALELDDTGVVDTTHDLDFLEDVGSLRVSAAQDRRTESGSAVDTDASPPRGES